MRNTDFELLAPAGSFETFRAVIEAGADAVYVGGSHFGARAYADNFTEEELLKAIDYAHLRGVKVYLTVNTLLKNSELEDELVNYLRPYYEKGLDAVLVQDFGALSFIHSVFPELPIHTSTQMTVTNIDGVKFLQKYGVTRVVMAREVSIAEMKRIHQETGMELEAFVHGALCYCYSGQCFFSSILGGRSGNRGRCAQPCRLPYTVGKENSYILSLKDMCGIKDIPKLKDGGVYSLKIEGRMKKASYAAGIVSIYRKYLDTYNLSSEDEKHIWDLGNRCGFTDTYYHKHNDSDMVTYVKPNYATDNEKYHEQIIDRYVNALSKLKINGKAHIFLDKPISLSLSYGDITVSATGQPAMAAKNVPLEASAVASRLAKTGDTDFEFDKLEVVCGEGVFVPNGALNKLRRDAIELLYEKILQGYRRSFNEDYIWHTLTSNNDNIESEKFIASVVTKEQLSAVLESKLISTVYVPIELSDAANLSLIKEAGKNVVLSLPSICRQRSENRVINALKANKYDGVVVKNYEELELVRRLCPDTCIIADHNLYTYNDAAVEAFKEAGVKYNTVPIELNNREIKARNNQDSEIIIYGHYPLMTAAGCVHKNTEGCDGKPQITYMTDRYNKQFAVRNYCADCYNVIYNCVPTYIWDKASQLRASGISRFRLDFTIEDAKQTEHILNLVSGIDSLNKTDEFTNGHFKRGVE